MQRRVESHVVDGQVAIRCLRRPGPGPTWVLLHGFGDAAACWARTVEALPDIDAIAVDARNHGGSGTGPGGPATHVADVVAVIDHFGLERPGLLGHSVGARTAALVGASCPDRVGSLVLVDPPWRGGTEDAAAAFESTTRAAIVADIGATAGLAEPALRELLATRHPDWDEVDGPPWIESKRRVRPEAADDLAPTAWGATVDALACPTLVICGGGGGIVDPDAAARIQQRNARVVTATIADAGHNVHREDFAAFVAVVEDWIASVSLGAGPPV